MHIHKNIEIDHRDYVITTITKNHKTAVKDLFHRCDDYFYLVEGRKANEASAKEFFEDLPPNKTLKDKHTLGIFQDTNLVGVIDLVEDYPNKYEWIIGLLLIDPVMRGKGLGQKIHKILMDIAKEGKAEKLRICVVEQNKHALEFWKKIGYQEIKRTEPRKYGEKECIVIVMNYLI